MIKCFTSFYNTHWFAGTFPMERFGQTIRMIAIFSRQLITFNLYTQTQTQYINIYVFQIIISTGKLKPIKYYMNTKTKYIDQPKIVCQKVSLQTIWSLDYSVCGRKSIISFYDIDAAFTIVATDFSLFFLSIYSSWTNEWTKSYCNELYLWQISVYVFIYILCLRYIRILTSNERNKKTTCSSTHIRRTLYRLIHMLSCHVWFQVGLRCARKCIVKVNFG